MNESLPVLIFLLVMVSLMVRNYQRRRAARIAQGPTPKGTRQGPVPGYSMLPGSSIQWDPGDPPSGVKERWDTTSMETIHAGSRTRLVVNLAGEEMEATECFTLLKSLAIRLARRTGFKVIAVQYVMGSVDMTAPSAILVYAPDSRGWTGTTTGATLTAVLPNRAAFRLETGSS